MDINIQNAVILTKPAAPILPKSAGAPLPEIKGPRSSQPVVEIKRSSQQAPQIRKEQLSDPFVVSDQRFTIFKDATGQYITRTVNLRSGAVQYLPEPQLKNSSSAPSIDIRA